jgi:hypothetical protein
VRNSSNVVGTVGFDSVLSSGGSNVAQAICASNQPEILVTTSWSIPNSPPDGPQVQPAGRLSFACVVRGRPISSDLRHSIESAVFSTVIVSMGGFSILTNRKRAVVALVHSVVFLMIAVRQVVAATPAEGVWVPSTVPPGTWILCGIFGPSPPSFCGCW